MIIHAVGVLGAYGFGYSLVDGTHKLSHQLGYVEIGDDVEIGAGTTIDRGTYGPTVIGEGTKIDNLVQIGHNCRIGRHNLICSQVGIAGSATTGDYVVMAGPGRRARSRAHRRRRDARRASRRDERSAAGPPRRRLAGDRRARAVSVWATMYKLPEMRKRLHELERQIEELTRRRGGSEGRWTGSGLSRFQIADCRLRIAE